MVRYRLDASGLPLPAGVWTFPAGDRPAAIARQGADLVATRHERGWLMVPRTAFAAIPSNRS